MNKNKENNIIILYGVPIIILFISYLLSLFGYNVVSNIFTIVFLVSLLIITLIITSFAIKISEFEAIQLFSIFCFIALFWNICTVSSFSSFCNEEIKWIGCVVFNSIVICYSIFLFQYFKKKLLNFNKNNLNYSLIFILFIFILLNIQTFDIWFKSDGYTYFSSIVQNLHTWDFSLNTLNSFEMGGHISFLYMAFLKIGCIFSNYYVAIRIVNVLLAIITIYLFNKIITKLLLRLDKVSIILLTCIFAFSPLFFGIVYELHTDYSIFCFFVWMIYFYLFRNKILCFFMMYAVCFSKETGAIIVAAFLLGIFLKNYFNQSKGSIFLKFKKSFTKNILISSSCLIFWIVSILFGNSGWAKEAQMIINLEYQESSKIIDFFDIEYIIYKLQELYIFHFAWIFSLLIITALILYIYKSSKNKQFTLKWCLNFDWLCVITSYLAFISINLFYFTYVHYRYIQLNSFFLTLFLGIIISYLFKRNLIRKYILSFILLIFIIESYITIDPITFEIAPNLNVGNGNIVSTKRYLAIDGELISADKKQMSYHYIYDGILHNREQIGLECLIEKAMDKIEYNNSKLIIVSRPFGDLPNTLLSLLGRKENNYYWDDKSENITDNENNIKINIMDSEEFQFVNTSQYSEIYYFNFNYNMYYSDNYFDKRNIIETKRITYGRWGMQIEKVK